MARKGGNPDIQKYKWKKGDPDGLAAKAAARSHEVRRKKKSMFASVRSIAEDCLFESEVPESIAKFWEQRGVAKTDITACMAEITPIYADAIKNRDWDSLYKVYLFLGLTFESNKEHNVNVSIGNKDDKPFEINYIVNGKKKEPEGEG